MKTKSTKLDWMNKNFTDIVLFCLIKQFVFRFTTNSLIVCFTASICSTTTYLKLQFLLPDYHK